MSLEFSVGAKNLQRLIAEFSPFGDLSNEAQTRFSFIDQFLKECLGWSEVGVVRVEVIERGDRTDYECGQPRQLIVEAKRASSEFRFPPRGAKTNARIRIRSLIDFDKVVSDAISQVATYCQSRGVQIAAISNGPQLVIFLANRLDGIAPLDGDALLFSSYEELSKGFNLAYEVLSPAGVQEKRLALMLSANATTGLPQKLSASCLNYFQHKYSSNFQESLKNAASLVVEDLGRTPDLEDDFLRDCYCESGPLSQFALLGKNLLSARYAALFSQNVIGSRIEEINPRRGGVAEFHQQALGEALARRPIVLIGDVGVGKSTFLKHLLRIRANKEFNSAISIYFDLGSKGVLAKSTKDALLDEVARTLRDVYTLNIQDTKLVEAIYKIQLREFETGIFSQLKSVDESEWLKKRLSLLSGLIEKREEHLRLCIEHLSITTKRQIIIIIDNADQRSLQVQQDAFLIAQELATHWKSMVFLALRPQTFHASKRSGAISAYPPKVFVIPPPKLEDVIEKRLAFALKVAEGTLPVQNLAGLRLHVDSLAILISILKRALIENKDLIEFIVNVSGGNVRIAIELVSRFFGSPNVESEKIVKLYKETKRYNIPLHEFSKVALLGDYSHFQEESSTASNIFSVVYPDKREHFLSLYILGYLAWDGAQKEHREGFVPTQTITREMQNCGFNGDQVQAHLARLTRKRLIETAERRQLETAEDIQESGMPESFRTTSLGAYHLKKWCGEFSYLEAIAFDTPIFENSVRERLAPHVNDSLLSARFQRAECFGEYLDHIWVDMPHPPYFDWPTLRAIGMVSFDRARRYLMENGL